MGNSDSINFSLSNLYASWYAFRRGKHRSSEVLAFQYNLEMQLAQLEADLVTKRYKHGEYAHFVVKDSKKREIAVAPVRDRLLHRLVYDYLTPIWDPVFIYDAWSCRDGKGQHKAIKRASRFMSIYRQGWCWRADITKFFDNVDQATLKLILRRRVRCPDALWLTDEIIDSYFKEKPGRGMPIGNLTSQIMANIYLNEFDRFMVHQLKPLAYLRYGDDWLCFTANENEARRIRTAAIQFLQNELTLSISEKLDTVMPVRNGVTYLGLDIWPTGKRITKATRVRTKSKLTAANFASYEALTKQFSTTRHIKQFYWQTIDEG